MTHRQIYTLTDDKLIITLPPAFKNKRVVVIVDDELNSQNDKFDRMKIAARDPLYLADLKEVNNDFESIEHETL